MSKEQNLIIVDNITVEVAGKKKGHYELELKWIDCIYTHVKQEKKKKKKRKKSTQRCAVFSSLPPRNISLVLLPVLWNTLAQEYEQKGARIKRVGHISTHLHACMVNTKRSAFTHTSNFTRFLAFHPNLKFHPIIKKICW